MAKKHLVRLLFELSQDAALRKRYRADADAVMAEHGLSAAEKKLLREGDARRVTAYLGAAWPMGPTIVKPTGLGPTIVKTAKAVRRKPRKPAKR
jgi:hypothetical protein